MSLATSSPTTAILPVSSPATADAGDETIERILQQARARGTVNGLIYAGSVTPIEAWDLFSLGTAILIDVRTIEERKFVGHVPGTLHVAWMTGTAMVKNPRFIKELSSKAQKRDTIVFLCRSGKRSADAAAAAHKAGFVNAFNVLEGFEGDLDENLQRGNGGWRHNGLPWVQD